MHRAQHHRIGERAHHWLTRGDKTTTKLALYLLSRQRFIFPLSFSISKKHQQERRLTHNLRQTAPTFTVTPLNAVGLPLCACNREAFRHTLQRQYSCWDSETWPRLMILYSPITTDCPTACNLPGEDWSGGHRCPPGGPEKADLACDISKAEVVD